MKLAHVLSASLLVMLAVASRSLAQQQASQPQSIDGRVINDAGDAVPEANIVVFGARQDNFVGWVNELLAQDKADSDGQFHIAAPKLSDYERVMVVARQEKLAVGSWNGASAELAYPVMLRLDQSQQIAGQVVDLQGQPIAGASVKAMLQWQADGRTHVVMGDALVPELMVTSDADGRFEFDALPQQAMATFAVVAEGYASVVWPNMRPSIPVGTDDVRIELPAESKIHGQVRCDTQGQSVEGLRVCALLSTSILTPCEARSDAEGRFTLEGLPASQVRLVAISEEAGDQLPWVGEAENLLLQPGQVVSDVTIDLQQAAMLKVTVNNWKEHKPLAGAKISVRDTTGNRGFVRAADENGAAQFAVLPGNYLLGAEHPECTPSQNLQMCDAAAGQTLEVSLVLTEAQMLQGEVFNREGQPVPGVALQVVPQNGRSTATTDAQGQFSMPWQQAEWVDPGTSMLIAQHEPSNSAAAVVIEDPASPVKVTLEPACSMSGRVLNENGEPMSGANISLMIYGGRWGSSLHDRENIRTNADGRFQVDLLPPGIDYGINASANGYGQQQWRQQAPEAGPIDLGEAKLLKADQKLTGLVVDSAGKPLANVQVQTYGEQQPHCQATSDKDGRFTLTGLCPGGVNLYANAQNPYRYGQTYATVGNGNEVKLIVSSGDPSEVAPEPKPQPLTGQQLPDLTSLGFEAAPQGKPVLLLFFDARQRPSRHAVKEILAQAASSSSAHIALVQMGTADDALLEALQITLPLARVDDSKLDEISLQWGVPALPWYLLADPAGKVILSDSSLTPASGQ